MRIGIYGGSFNPIHNGHVALCDFLIEEQWVDEVWLIRSPLNPLKVESVHTLASDKDRQQMLELGIEGHPGLKTCTIEDELPRPSYTIDTLNALRSLCPDAELNLIVGADNWLVFDRWKDWEQILRDYRLIIYPRPGSPLPEIDPALYPTVRVVDAPQYDLSSTEIRDRIARGEGIEGLVPPAVEDYILRNHIFRVSQK